MPADMFRPQLGRDGAWLMEPDYLSAALGLTDEMIIDLIEWGLASATHDIPQDAYARRGAELAERLRAELAGNIVCEQGHSGSTGRERETGDAFIMQIRRFRMAHGVRRGSRAVLTSI